MASVIVGVSSFSSSSSYYSYCVWGRRRRRNRRSYNIITPPPIIRLISPPLLIINHFNNHRCYSSYYSSTTTTIASSSSTTRGLMWSSSSTIIDHSADDTTITRNNNIYNNNNNNNNNISVIDATKCDNEEEQKRERRVLLLDIMDTIVRDPFYQDIPAFFQMSLEELINCKHPTAWIDFETGLIDEMELARNFFKDGRPFDLEGLKNCMTRGYSYIPGMEELLGLLKQNNYEMHALTNYPIWYEMIEDKLKLSKYLSWSFCSCAIGKRKPDMELYEEVVRCLNVEPENCIFIDDRMKNVEAAVEAGMVGLQFKDSKTLQNDLSLLGIQTQYQKEEVEEEEEEEDVAS